MTDDVCLRCRGPCRITSVYIAGPAVLLVALLVGIPSVTGLAWSLFGLYALATVLFAADDTGLAFIGMLPVIVFAVSSAGVLVAGLLLRKTRVWRCTVCGFEVPAE